MRLTLALLGHRLPKPPRKRRMIMHFNNAWQEGRHLKVEDKGYVEACRRKGIQVFDPQEVTSSHLPEVPEVDFDFERNLATKFHPIEKQEDHPHFHETPAYTFVERSFFPKYRQLDHAKVLCKAVEVQGGLPQSLVRAIDSVTEDKHDNVQSVLRETQLFDATQQKLPINYNVPYIGWHPVEDRMFRKMPYDVSQMSWGRKMPREYGIPFHRRNMNLMRGLLRCCDDLVMSSNELGVLGRRHIERNQIRHFFKRNDKLVRFLVPIHQIVTDCKPLPPFADERLVKSTSEIKLPDISPFDPLVGLWPTNVYNDRPFFPLLPMSSDLDQASMQSEHVHTCIEHNNNPIKNMRTPEGYHARSLALAFIAAMAQAQQRYGHDFRGDLPEPVSVNFVSTNGELFHFSCFQLNTLNLDDPEGVKNIYWHEEELSQIHEVCSFVKGKPTLEGYDPSVFCKFLSLYSQGLN